MVIHRIIGLLAALGIASSSLFGSGGARLAITVLDEKGAPVDGAAVSVTSPGSNAFKMALKTDPKGRAQAILIRTDWNYLVRAEKNGASTRPTLVKLSSEESRSLSLALVGGPPAAAPGADDAESLFGRGLVLYNSGDFRGAGAIFARLTQEHRDMAKAYFQLAMCEYQLKRNAESRATFQRYLDLAPSGDLAAEARKMLQSIPEH